MKKADTTKTMFVFEIGALIMLIGFIVDSKISDNEVFIVMIGVIVLVVGVFRMIMNIKWGNKEPVNNFV